MAKIQITESELKRIIKESVEAVLNEGQDEGDRKRPKKPVTLQGKTREAARKVQSTINQGINRAQRNMQQNLNTAKNVAGQACDGLGYYAGRAASKVANGFNRGYTGAVNEGTPDGGEFKQPDFMQTSSKKPEPQKAPAKKQTFPQKVKNARPLHTGMHEPTEKLVDKTSLKDKARRAVQTFRDARERLDSLENANAMSDNPITRFGQALRDNGPMLGL